MTGDEGAVAGEQQQLLQSIHAMIGNLEAEKRSYLHMLDSSQVCRCCLLPCHPVHSYGHNCTTHGLLDDMASRRGGGTGRQAGLSMLASCVFVLSLP